MLAICSAYFNYCRLHVTLDNATPALAREPNEINLKFERFADREERCSHTVSKSNGELFTRQSFIRRS
jgi:hypothetical protein